MPSPYNIYKCMGRPHQRPLAQQAVKLGQMPIRLADELALYEPDIRSFSESPEESVVKEIAQRIGMTYVDFSSGLNWPGALLTRFEIAGAKHCPVVGGERPVDPFTRQWLLFSGSCPSSFPIGLPADCLTTIEDRR